MQRLHSIPDTHLVLMAVTSTGLKMLSDSRLKRLLQKLTEEFVSEFCPVCGWKHDSAFHEIQFPDGRKISLPDVPARLVQLLHASHENRIVRLGVKDDSVKAVCGGYHHPCKAFGDLGRKGEYSLLITRSRGFISLRKHQPVAIRKHSQSNRNDEKPSLRKISS